jgi:hypothetical protein
VTQSLPFTGRQGPGDLVDPEERLSPSAIASVTSKGLEAALKVALRTLPASPSSRSSALLHRALATALGACAYRKFDCW